MQHNVFELSLVGKPLEMLDDLALRDPKAAAADPRAFVDMSLIAELEKSGFIKELYRR